MGSQATKHKENSTQTIKQQYSNQNQSNQTSPNFVPLLSNRNNHSYIGLNSQTIKQSTTITTNSFENQQRINSEIPSPHELTISTSSNNSRSQSNEPNKANKINFYFKNYPFSNLSVNNKLSEGLICQSFIPLHMLTVSTSANNSISHSKERNNETSTNKTTNSLNGLNHISTTPKSSSPTTTSTSEIFPNDCIKNIPTTSEIALTNTSKSETSSAISLANNNIKTTIQTSLNERNNETSTNKTTNSLNGLNHISTTPKSSSPTTTSTSEIFPNDCIKNIPTTSEIALTNTSKSETSSAISLANNNIKTTIQTSLNERNNETSTNKTTNSLNGLNHISTTPKSSSPTTTSTSEIFPNDCIKNIPTTSEIALTNTSKSETSSAISLANNNIKTTIQTSLNEPNNETSTNKTTNSLNGLNHISTTPKSSSPTTTSTSEIFPNDCIKNIPTTSESALTNTSKSETSSAISLANNNIKTTIQTSLNVQLNKLATNWVTIGEELNKLDISTKQTFDENTIAVGKTKNSLKKTSGFLESFAWKIYRSKIPIKDEEFIFSKTIDGLNMDYNLVKLDINSNEYQSIKKDFLITAKKYIVHEIERVDNPFLFACYEWKKEELRKRYGFVYEINVFHGTKSENIQTICQNNFDWRLFGINKGNRFGKGVSFSQKSYYSSHYRNKKSINQIMFVVKLAYCHLVPGESTDILPPLGINLRNEIIDPDTTFKEHSGLKKDVLVKFSDHEFYPAYIIHYSGNPYTNRI